MKTFWLCTLLFFSTSSLLGHSLPSEQNKSGRIISPSRDLKNFTLPSHKGKDVTFQEHKGRQIVFFGFTTCREVCPVGLAYLSSELKLAGEAASDVRILFITVDPKNDTLPKITDWLKSFSPKIIGLRGDANQTEAIAADFGSPMGKRGEEVMHGAWFYLIDQQGKWKGFYRLPLEKGVLAKDLKKLSIKKRS